jgi:hypothetical protein
VNRRTTELGTLNDSLRGYIDAGCASLLAIAAEMTRVVAVPVLAAQRDGTLASLEEAHIRKLRVAGGAIAWTLAAVPAAAATASDQTSDYRHLVAPLLQAAAILRRDRVHPWELGSQATLPRVMYEPTHALERLLTELAPSREHSQRMVDRYQRTLLDIAHQLGPQLDSWRPHASAVGRVDPGLLAAGRVDYTALARELMAQDDVLANWTSPTSNGEPTPAQVTEARATLAVGADGSLSDAIKALPAVISDVLDDLPGSSQRSQDGPRTRWLGVTGALDVVARSPDVPFGVAAGDDRTQTAPTQVSTDPPRIGRYRIVRELGRGGMAAVYEAYDETLNRPVALKVAAAAARDAALLRFEDEVRIAAQLQHPGLVPVYDAGTSSGRPWLAMRLIDGPALAALARPFNVERSLAILSTLAETLDYVHSHGIVHRDIKPSNVLLQDAGEEQERPLLADFGIARLANGERHTHTGHVIGTVGWMAPELSAGVAATPASDIWSLARLLIFMLTNDPAASLAPDRVASLLGARGRTSLIAALDGVPANRPVRATELRAALLGDA